MKILIDVLVENVETTLTQISKMLGLALEGTSQVTDSDERYFFSCGLFFFFYMNQKQSSLGLSSLITEVFLIHITEVIF